jgi:sugar phosphate isomerase/epimerase
MKKFILLLPTIFILVSCGVKEEIQKKEISLQLYSLRADIVKDYDATIKKVAEIGYTSVEAAGYSNGKFYGKTPAEFRQDVENAGMTVLSSHTTKLLTEQELKSKI